MPLISLHDKRVIEPFLRRNVYLHLYALGDLDDFFWPSTTWYAIEDAGRIEAVLLLYHAPQTPTLLALADPPYEPLCQLLRSAARLLPPLLYAHFSPGCWQALEPDFQFASNGLHSKMALRDPARLAAVDTTGVVPLSSADLDEMRALYAASYPGAWYDPRLVAAGCSYGIRQDGALVSVGSVHVLSPVQRVAAPGAITTHPAWRGRGFAGRLTAKICTALLSQVDTIGLNVKADNQPALACYRRLGFERVADYEEGFLRRGSEPGA
jgi:ribosomal protein S18 acetylase RimI-like enzyme